MSDVKTGSTGTESVDSASRPTLRTWPDFSQLPILGLLSELKPVQIPRYHIGRRQRKVEAWRDLVQLRYFKLALLVWLRVWPLFDGGGSCVKCDG
jgi:hypothetical protein